MKEVTLVSQIALYARRLVRLRAAPQHLDPIPWQHAQAKGTPDTDDRPGAWLALLPRTTTLTPQQATPQNPSAHVPQSGTQRTRSTCAHSQNHKDVLTCP